MKMKRSVVVKTCSCISWCRGPLNAVREDEELSATQGHGYRQVLLHTPAAYSTHAYALATRLLGEATVLESQIGVPKSAEHGGNACKGEDVEASSSSSAVKAGAKNNP